MTRFAIRFLVVLLGLCLVGCTGESDPDPASSAAPSTERSDEPRIETISQGERVELADHLVPGAYTIIEFGADW